MSKKLFMKPLKVLASPGMYLLCKFAQFKRRGNEEEDENDRSPTERDLSQLNVKIDKLLSKLDGKDAEIADTPDEECVICVNAKAVMQTYPCGHKVVCRRCFVKTIQVALTRRTLPLRCVICRTRIVKLKHGNDHQDPNGSEITGKRFSRRPCRDSRTKTKNDSGFSQKCHRTCSLNSCSAMKTKLNTQKYKGFEMKDKKQLTLDENKMQQFGESQRSREALIQKFQKDFKEGKQRNLTSRIT